MMGIGSNDLGSYWWYNNYGFLPTLTVQNVIQLNHQVTSKHRVMTSHCVTTCRHCLDMWTHLDISRYLLTLSRHKDMSSTSMHCLHTSRHCLETIMIALENGLERKKIKYMYEMALNICFYMYLGHVFLYR